MTKLSDFWHPDPTTLRDWQEIDRLEKMSKEERELFLLEEESSRKKIRQKLLKGWQLRTKK